MAEEKLHTGPATSAMVQKGAFKKKPPYSDGELSSAAGMFNAAVSTANSIINIATNLKTLTSNDPVDKKNNYYLTDAQKTLLKRRALEFSNIGIVPYDVLEDFLFVLCAIDNYDLLSYVAAVTGVVELDNPSFVREPDLILNCRDLSKIGYLANGLAALTRQINAQTFPQTSSKADNTSSAYSALQFAASAASIPGAAAAATSIAQFPGVDIFSSVLGQIVSISSVIQGLVSTFSAPGNTATKVAQIPQVLAQITAVTSQLTNILNVSQQQNIAGLFPIADQLKTVMKQVSLLEDLSASISNAATSNSFPNIKVGDYSETTKSIFEVVNKVSTTLSSLTSMVSSLASPGNIGGAAASMLKAPGGLVPSSQLTKEALGQAVPPGVLANNPVLQAASYIGRAFFGEALVPIAAIDQMFSRPIGNYPRPSSGAGTASFKMQNFASMGGSMNIQQALMQVVYGITSVTPGSPLATLISQQASDVANTLGATLTTAVELRRSDNAIPMMIGMSTVLANDTSCPFSTSSFSNGWKIASSVGNDLQKYNPKFLQHIQTSA